MTWLLKTVCHEYELITVFAADHPNLLLQYNEVYERCRADKRTILP